MKDHKVKLALRIIGEQFGDIVQVSPASSVHEHYGNVSHSSSYLYLCFFTQDVAKVLTEGDKCTLPHLFRTVNANIAARAAHAAAGGSYSTAAGLGANRSMAVDGATVRSALMVLHQQGCLLIEKPKQTDAVSDNPSVKPVVQTGFLYSLNVTNVLHRMNFSRMLSIIRTKHGELARHVAEVVMLHGKMRLDQIQDQVILEEMASNADGTASSASEVKAAFEALVSNRFIITVPQVDKVSAGEHSVTFDVASESKSGVKRAFDFLGTSGTSGADASNKRSKTSASASASSAASGKGKTAGSSSSASSGNGNGSRRGSIQKLAPLESDDGIPVELRMLMGGFDSSSSGKNGITSQNVNIAHRSTRDAPEAEWDDQPGT